MNLWPPHGHTHLEESPPELGSCVECPGGIAQQLSLRRGWKSEPPGGRWLWYSPASGFTRLNPVEPASQSQEGSQLSRSRLGFLPEQDQSRVSSQVEFPSALRKTSFPMRENVWNRNPLAVYETQESRSMPKKVLTGDKRKLYFL